MKEGTTSNCLNSIAEKAKSVIQTVSTNIFSRTVYCEESPAVGRPSAIRRLEASMTAKEASFYEHYKPAMTVNNGSILANLSLPSWPVSPVESHTGEILVSGISRAWPSAVILVRKATDDSKVTQRL